MQILEHKRGDVFAFYATLTDNNNTPLNVTVDKLKSQIRTDDDVLISELVIELTDVVGKYLFTALSTQSWNIGILYCDIENNDVIKTSSDTFAINVVKDVTHNE